MNKTIIINLNLLLCSCWCQKWMAS